MTETIDATDATADASEAPGAREALTELLHAWRGGEAAALDQLATAVHGRLLGMARRAMRGERPAHTLQPTALVHEAFLKLMGSEVSWQDRAHFFAVAATVMRRILVDHARTTKREKRGGGAERVTLCPADGIDPGPNVDLIELDGALKRLAKKDPAQCRMIEYAYFGGLSYRETAEVMGVSRTTVGRELRFAKVWLKRQLLGVREVEEK